MVDISLGVQNLLDSYIARYVDSKNSDDYCVSSFWRWYYQLRSHIYKLDRIDSAIGSSLKYSMDYWGDIYYSSNIINGIVFVVVEQIDINATNFSNWIRYNTLPTTPIRTDPSSGVTSWECDGTKPYNNIYKVVSNNGLFSLADENNNLLIGNRWFSKLEFPFIDNDYMGYSIIGLGKSYADIQYLILPNLKVIHPAAVAIRNRRKIENKQYISRIITDSINNFLCGIVKEDRDKRIGKIVRESIDRFINQIVA